MKKTFLLMLVFSALLACAKGRKEITSTNSQMMGQSGQDWESWLVKYDSFIDEYIILMKKLQVGDQTATLKAMDFAKKGQTLSEEALELDKILDQKNRKEFNASYEAIQKKLEDAGLNN